MVGPIYSEECDCPSGTQKWLMDQARCPPISPQILTDLKPFPIIRPEYNRKVELILENLNIKRKGFIVLVNGLLVSSFFTKITNIDVFYL